MPSNRLALTALGLACVAAAGAGSYFATRQNVASVAVPAASAAFAPPAAPAPSAPPPSVQPTGMVAPSTPEATRELADAAPASTTTSNKPRTKPAPAPVGHLATRPTLTKDTVAARTDTPPSLTQTGATASTLPAHITAAAGVQSVVPPAEPSLDSPQASEPPASTFEELVVSADSVIGLQTEGLLSSERAHVEDRVEARVVRDVRVGREIAIPAGTRALGTVVVVERGGKVRERARLGIRFETLLMADGTRMPITTETIYRYGDAPSNGSAARIGGGAVAGAILGAIIGGGKGAAIGATTGAGAGTAAVMGRDRSAATFPSGSEVTARILSPLTVTVERE
jgi:hypothetical protein